MNLEEVPFVEKCYGVSKSNISLEENSSCLQTPMTKFRLKRSRDKWFAEVTARAPCAKKQAKEVMNPNSSPKENASCFRTTSSQKIEKSVSDDPSIHLNFLNSQYTEVIRKTDGPSSSYVQNEPFDQRSYMDVLGGEEGKINKPRPFFSCSVQREKRNNVGCTKKRRRDLRQSLFSPNGLQDGTKLAYVIGGEVILEGYKQGDGIVCIECDTKMSPSDFEVYAKYPKRGQTNKYIRTANGHTLHEIALRLSDGESIQSIMSSSDVCLGLEGIPTGDWHCSRFAENIGPNGRDPNPVISKPDRVVKPPVYQPGGCVLCKFVYVIAVK